MIEVATANMYVAFSNVLARHGLDPRDFALVAFGGAGPVEACFLAEEFHIPRVIVPPSPGTLCAQGAMTADVKSDYVKTLHRRLSATSGRLLADECAELAARARRWLAEEAPPVSASALAFSADLRYVGQAFQVEVPIAAAWLEDGTTDHLRSAFHDRHERLYAHADRAADVELIDLRATITGTTPKPTLDGGGDGRRGPRRRRAGGRSTTGSSGTTPPCSTGRTYSQASTFSARPSSSRTTRPRWCRPGSAPTSIALGNLVIERG